MKGRDLGKQSGTDIFAFVLVSYLHAYTTRLGIVTKVRRYPQGEKSYTSSIYIITLGRSLDFLP